MKRSGRPCSHSFRPGQPRTAATLSGLTLIEALVVLAIISILLAILLPTITNGPCSPSLTTTCRNNTKQLTLGWLIYASDNNDRLIANQPYSGLPEAPTNNWVRGVMDWSANPQNTNVALLMEGKGGILAAYVKSWQPYHCPADQSASAAGPRVRSYSMNGFLGDPGQGQSMPGWRQFLKTADVAQPSQRFVIIDEHANSIDDGYFFNNPAGTNQWLDLPAARHNGGDGISFADGHFEIHIWQEASTKQPVVPNALKRHVAVEPSHAEDLDWLLQRTTEPAITNRQVIETKGL